MNESGQGQPVSVRREGDVAVVTIDNPPVNALSQAVRRGLMAAMASLGADPSVSAVVLAGAGARFIAGADLREMEQPPSEPLLPDVVRAIGACPKPTLAAIAGAALGGGFEVALACDARIGAPGATVGLPETRIGLVPGASGTQVLPRLIGLAKAIGLIGEARILGAEEAVQLGLIDRIVPQDLLTAAVEHARTLAKRPVAQLPVPLSSGPEIEAAAASALKRTKGNPAIAEAIRLIRLAAELPFDSGLAEERRSFLSLRQSAESRALRHLFFAEREATKGLGLEGVAPRPLAHAAVIGAGTMGAGIAVALADSGLQVSVIERDAQAVAQGCERIGDHYARQTASGRLAQRAAEERLSKIAVGSDWSVVAQADLVIEAVFEDLRVKHEVFARLDDLARPGALLASNTSYLDLNVIAAQTRRPQDVLGLHFFAPAPVMRLLEIVRGERTSADTLATGLALARRLSKVAVVAGVCEGFIGNRIYSRYRQTVERMVEDHADPQAIDAALEAYGFAMGPFAVADLSGLDIGWANRKRRAALGATGERDLAIADRLCEIGRFGRKSGSGWYAYDDATKRGRPDGQVEAIIAAERRAKGIRPTPIGTEEIQNQVLAVMANEGARILGDGIAQKPSDIDLVLVHGYGFPAVKGGPMFAADAHGLDTVLEQIRRLGPAAGAGFEPAPLLIELAAQGSSFAAWQKARRGAP